MTRRLARAPRGQRALGSVPFGGWHRLTVIGALSTDGMIAAMSVAAPVNAALLRIYLDEVLVPERQRRKPDAILVMDNLRPHLATVIGKTLKRAHLGGIVNLTSAETHSHSFLSKSAAATLDRHRVKAAFQNNITRTRACRR
jgi:uncharacterized Fe-S center protein